MHFVVGVGCLRENFQLPEKRPLVLVGMSNSNFPNFFLSPPHHSLLAMEKKSTQLHTLIDFHSNFGQALRWVPATYAPPAFNLIT